MLLPLLLSLLPQDTFAQPSTALQGLVFLMRSPTSVARSGYFLDMRSALAVADDGDTLILEPGLFTGPGNKDLVVTKDVAIRGRCGSSGSTIDCEGAGRAFDFQDAQAVVQGLTIRRGVAPYGGGAYVTGGTVLFADVTFEENSAESGGGVSSFSATVLFSSCRFIRNSAGWGGGVYMSGGGAVSSSLFEGNSASNLGGGLLVELSATVPVVDCIFQRNSAGTGGGISNFIAGSMHLDRCTIADNEATVGYGGGIGLIPGPLSLVTNSLVVGNTSATGTAGIQGTSVGVLNCTVVGNTSSSTSAAGVQVGTVFQQAYIVNCVVRGNASNATTTVVQQIGSTFGVTLRFNNIEGLSGSPTNFDLDPQFVAPASGDFHLLPSSPCVDAGITFAAASSWTDFDGEPRFQGLSVDIGCDEVPVGVGP